MNVALGVTHVAAAAAFDDVANSYDGLFTYTAIGRAQRVQVWSRLLAAFWPSSRILELNCGTGEDARFLAEKGRSVVACDASAAMISVARSRTCADRTRGSLEFLQIANESLNVLAGQRRFDGAFSNFAGLNCVADLKPVAEGLANLVKPRGRVLLCIWSRACVAEVLWYLFHAEPSKAVRRFSRNSSARLGQKAIPVFYPSVREVRRCFAPWFRLIARRAIGLFVPPSYCERVIRKREKLLTRMEWFDRQFAHWPVLRDAGDHVLLEFVRCSP
jgi:ubiquinone/menaquinone biosynthesis C-methylase UbiE